MTSHIRNTALPAELYPSTSQTGSVVENLEEKREHRSLPAQRTPSSLDISTAKEQLLEYLFSDESQALIGPLDNLKRAFLAVYGRKNQDPRRAFNETGLVVTQVIEQVASLNDGIVGRVFFYEGFDQVSFVDNIVQSVLKKQSIEPSYEPSEKEIQDANSFFWLLIEGDPELFSKAIAECWTTYIYHGKEFETAFITDLEDKGIKHRSLSKIFTETLFPALRSQVDDDTRRTLLAPIYPQKLMQYILDQSR